MSEINKHFTSSIESDLIKIKAIKTVLMISLVVVTGIGLVFIMLESYILKIALIPTILLAILFGFIYTRIKTYKVLDKNHILIGGAVVSTEKITSVKRFFQDKHILSVKYLLDQNEKTALLLSPKIKTRAFYPENFKDSYISNLEKFLKNDN